jgi:hypothetical protein
VESIRNYLRASRTPSRATRATDVALALVLRHIGLRTFQTQKPFEDTAATRNQNAQKAFHDAEGLSQPHNGPVKALR